MNRNAGQMILMGIPGPELAEGLRQLIREIQPGGFILFARNLATAEQTFELIAELNSLCKIQPTITVDQEGGRVARLNMIGERPPSAQELRDAGNANWCREHGVLTGKLLAMLGFNLNLAPVVDFSPDDKADNSLRGRCFGRTPQEVVEKAGAFLDGMQNEGVLGTAKHFPGYTFCQKDPHGALPMIERTREEIFSEELFAFRVFAPKADAMMIGHGHFTAWHKESFPASLSPRIVGDLLRTEMGYQGLVMTDDIEMGAIIDTYGSAETTRLAVEAGQDMILICHNPASVQISYETLLSMPPEKLNCALGSISQFKQKLLPPPQTFSAEKFRGINAQIHALRKKIPKAKRKRPKAQPRIMSWWARFLSS